MPETHQPRPYPLQPAPPRRPGLGPRMWPIRADEELGWWPYVNLSYLVFVFLPLLFMRPVGALQIGSSVAAVAVFLPLYFAGYRAVGWRCYAIMAAIAAIGFVLIPVNPGGNTFLIYAIALAAHTLSARATALGIVALMALMAAQIGWLGWPWALVGLTAMIGSLVAVGSLYARAEARRNAQLKLSQEEVRRLARTAERERIGRDLHDLLGHTLSLIALKSELALKLFERDPPAARAEMAAVERITRDALAQVRSAVTGIRSTGIEAELASARLALLSAEVTLDYRLAPLELSEEAGTVLALAIREAVTNVMRHARASRVEIELAAEAGAGGNASSARLDITDDGRGADLVEGNGLLGMRERVAALGGRLEMACAPGAGMRLSIVVPCASAGDGQRTAVAHATAGGTP